MVYLTVDEFKVQNQPEITNLTSNDTPDTSDDTVIEELIDLAEVTIDVYLGISYVVDDIRAYVLLPTYKRLKDLLSRFTFVITKYFLYQRKSASVSGSVVEKEFEMAIDMLKGIRDGKLKLPGVSLYVGRKSYTSTKDDYVLNTDGFKDFGNYETNRQY
jgi:phage gp36-like protein